MKDAKQQAPAWSRRAFLAVLGTTAVAVAVRLPPEAERPRSVWNGKTRWIGHC